MVRKIKEKHDQDPDGNPAGGLTIGVGINIKWQNGPLGRGSDRKEPNGAFVEEVIQAAIGRLKFYQDSKFKSKYNSMALGHLEMALWALDQRTQDREAREVEGTHAA